MTTPLRQGKKLVRVVPSRSHDARKTKRMVVELDHTGLLPEICLRPAGKRTGVSITVDGCYEMLVKLGAG
ncbi:MAG: hypothetical protein KF754_00550 [Planctomycetes bacterium]|nr:hypothetical protein [Planctomycetota bacterium]